MINKNKINLIITSAILAVALVIAVITGVQFASFRNYETQFNIDNVDEIFKFSDFSPNLKGTVGDSNIYAMYGSQNTVALVNANGTDFKSADDFAGANICYVKGQNAQLSAAKQVLGNFVDNSRYTQVNTAREACLGLQDGTYDVAIMGYGLAKNVLPFFEEDVKMSQFELEKVPSILILGGTHPNEPSGQLAATLYLENAQVERGIVYVVTEMNKSAYSHSQPQEASAWYYEYELEDGSVRKFKYGSRATNTVDQWPTPDVYTHSSGAQLSSSEVRNLNRAYPGSPTGTYTEQLAWAITNFVIQKNVTIAIDLHEASPEYAVNNAHVFHQDTAELWSLANEMVTFELKNMANAELVSNVTGTQPTSVGQLKGEESPVNFHGLTHRDLGDFTGAYVVLMETSNASQGKLHGAFKSDLITCEGHTDKFYKYAWEQTQLYQQSGGEDGIKLLQSPASTLAERVARHVDSIYTIITAFSDWLGTTRSEFTQFNNSLIREVYPNLPVDYTPASYEVGGFVINGIPSYADIFVEGIATYLKPINQ